MAGWNLKSGLITEYDVSEDRIWSLFNYVFSNSSRKRNTYKFGLVKSLLDNVFNGQQKSDGIYFTYEELFGRFAENYAMSSDHLWMRHLKQMLMILQMHYIRSRNAVRIS